MIAKARLMWYKDLKREVIDEKCVLCGTCVAACPTFAIKIENRAYNVAPYLSKDCIACGLCFAFCPRAGLDTGISKENAIGDYIAAFSAKSKIADIKEKAQDGGIVSSILIALFRNKEIDAAVVTGAEEMPWKAHAEIIASEEEVMKYAGSVYNQSYVNNLIKKAVDRGYRKLAVVGLPCEIEGLRAIKNSTLKALDYKVIRYLIGLFCTENFDYAMLFQQKIPELGFKSEEIEKIEIEKGMLITYGKSSELFRISVRKLREAVLYGCNFCRDFAANFADISIGSTGSRKGFSSVIVRTEEGKKAFELAGELFCHEAVHCFDEIKKIAEFKIKRAEKHAKR